MNPDAVTIQDCEENFYRKNQAVILAAGKVVGFTDDQPGLTVNKIVRYTDLVDRRQHIIMHSGQSWQPEYEAELQEIDRELAELRPLIDMEQKGAPQPVSAAEPCI